VHPAVREARGVSRGGTRGCFEVFAKESNWCTRGLQPDETDLSTDMQVQIMQMSRRGEWTLMRRMGRRQGQSRMVDPQGRLHALRDPGCLKACPAPGAIVQYASGVVDFLSDACIGCGYCVEGCPFDIPRIGREITSPANARSARIASAWGSCRHA
jgi:Fe-S-cluster-containing dehydrogenase component